MQQSLGSRIVYYHDGRASGDFRKQSDFAAYSLLVYKVSGVKLKFFADEVHRVSEDPKSIPALVGDPLALPGQDLLFSCPVGMVGEMMKGFGVGHEAEDAA